MRAKRMEISGWGRALSADVRAWRPERAQALQQAFQAEREDGVIVYAGGRSYGDAPLNSGGDVILTERLDRILSADWETGEVVCEPGVAIGDLMRAALKRKWIVPVSPGTGFATVGGGVANDVHGKNQHCHGNFGDHVQWIDLLLPSGDVKRITPEGDRDLFEATAGGIGLTGIMLAIAIKLRRVKSNAVLMRERKARDLEEFLAMQLEARGKHTYVVGWIDAMARGRSLGRGIMESADESQGATDAPSGRRTRMPTEMPGFAMNRLSISLFNGFYYHRLPFGGGRERQAPVTQFLYPLDSIEDWNLLYGKRGFYQFQCVLPEAESAVGMRKLMEAISEAGTGSFLAVLKSMGRWGRGHLSFPMPGFTLALDFPAKPGVTELLDRLERITLDHGGRIYLAKDGAMSAESFAQMYPRLNEFRAILDRIDPNRMMDSDMSRRLKIRG